VDLFGPRLRRSIEFEVCTFLASLVQSMGLVALVAGFVVLKLDGMRLDSI
jgi:hypothetical protein